MPVPSGQTRNAFMSITDVGVAETGQACYPRGGLNLKVSIVAAKCDLYIQCDIVGSFFSGER